MTELNISSNELGDSMKIVISLEDDCLLITVVSKTIKS